MALKVGGLEKCQELRILCKQTRNNFIDMARLLYEINAGNYWEGKYSSFAEFTDDCQLERPFVARIMKVYEVYVINNGISSKKLAEAGWTKLYMAIPLIGKKSASDVVGYATEVSQRDLGYEVADALTEAHECKWEELRVRICTVCHKKEALHENK